MSFRSSCRPSRSQASTWLHVTEEFPDGTSVDLETPVTCRSPVDASVPSSVQKTRWDADGALVSVETIDTQQLTPAQREALASALSEAEWSFDVGPEYEPETFDDYRLGL